MSTIDYCEEDGKLASVFSINVSVKSLVVIGTWYNSVTGLWYNF